MPTEDPFDSLSHVGNGVPCKHFNHHNGGCLSGPTCAYMHAPDDSSLRLKLDGPNICEAHLVRKGPGCTKGTRCWYSHDFERGAGFPVDDPVALRDTLQGLIMMPKPERRTVTGDFIRQYGGGAPCLDMTHKSGHSLLKALGGSRPDVDSPRPRPTGPSVLSAEEQSMFGDGGQAGTSAAGQRPARGRGRMRGHARGRGAGPTNITPSRTPGPYARPPPPAPVQRPSPQQLHHSARQQSRMPRDEEIDDYDDWDDPNSNPALLEMLSYGVKPWDDDAFVCSGAAYVSCPVAKHGLL